MRQPVPFGKYLLLERISVGGMAEVFKARALNGSGPNGKVLAIKRILPSMAEDADFIQMFIDEAKISGQLTHQNIAQIYELGRHEDTHFISMEFVWGKDLLQIQNRFRRIKQTMKPQMAAYIAARMSEGLDYAHKKVDASGKLLGIIHRDVSPQNILCSYDGVVKVIDFGIAKAASRSTRTQAGVLKGKFGYMSPEQVRGLPLDRRSDIFAIATILYEMLTAERLFLGESDFATLEKVRNVDIPPPSKAAPGCPPELERIIMKGLARDVDDRYQWASEMAEDLKAFLQVHDANFGNAHLAQWMREQFAAEIKREQGSLDELQKAAAIMIAQGQISAPQSIGSDVPEGTNQLDVGDLDFEGHGESTQISSPAFADDGLLGPTEATLDSASSAALAEVAAEVRDIANQSTRILDEGGPSAPQPLASQSTMILDGSHPSPLAAQSTMILQDGHPKPPLASQSTMILDTSHPSPLAAQSTMILQDGHPKPPLASQSTMILDSAGLPPQPGQSTMILPAAMIGPNATQRPPSSNAPPIVDRALRQASPETDFVQPIGQLQKKKSTAARDISIVVVIALVLGGGGFAARTLLAKKVGSMVVTVSPPLAATVFVDETQRGSLKPGEQLTLKELVAGPHHVVVQSAQGKLDQQIVVAADATSAVAATFKTVAKPTGIGKLRLDIKTANAAVYIDGAQLDEDTWREPIPLKSGIDHELRVSEPTHDDYKTVFQLDANQELAKTIELPAAAGHLEVKTDPAGAEVTINGKLAGISPLKLDNLDYQKDAKVQLRKHGFVQQNHTVSFLQDHHQTLDVHLSPEGHVEVASASGGKSDESASSKSSGASSEFALLPDKKGPPPAAIATPAPATTTPKPAPTPTAPATPVVATSKPEAADSDVEGYLIANTQPWAKVVIDGKDTGKTTPIPPQRKIALKPGKHIITFLANGKSYNFDIMVKPGQDVHLMRQLSDE